jgi:hypothetical protein
MDCQRFEEVFLGLAIVLALRRHMLISMALSYIWVYDKTKGLGSDESSFHTRGCLAEVQDGRVDLADSAARQGLEGLNSLGQSGAE